MRFDLLLAQYLQQHKKLALPGIGTFESDNSTATWDENGKQRQPGNGVVFRNIPVSRAEDDLITFISEHTGKMKPLAISDLESYLTLGKQFLYIGKPFFLEGIGTLQFTKSGHFEFTPGDFVTTKLDEPMAERVEERRRPTPEEVEETETRSRGGGRKVFMWLIVLLCLGLVAWGGYYFYTQSAKQQVFTPVNNPGNQSDTAATVPAAATEQAVAGVDSSKPAPAGLAPVPGSSSFRFVVEQTTDKQRAMNRYRKLKSFGNDIQLFTPDSTNFTLYFILPATAADTLRMRDSLNRWYYGNNKVNRVQVQQ